MKVLFVTHDVGYTDNVGVAFLSAIAKELGHKTFYCSLDRDDLITRINVIQPDVVGYSVNIRGYRRVVEMNKQAKELFDFVSIMGGPFPTMCPESFDESGMDAYCVGEGELAFRDFLVRVDRGESFGDIPNLITSEGYNPVRPLIKDLDSLPMPDRNLIFSNCFLGGISKKTFFTSRGCPFSCSYCCNNHFNKLYGGQVRVRRFSVDRVLREIESVRGKYRMDFVKFDDDCFALRKDSWLEEFAEKYPRRVGVPFNCVLRLDVLDEELLCLLKKAGCFSVHLSVDSTSEFVRENVLNRKMKCDIIGKLRLVRSFGINTYVNFMTGIPGSCVWDDLDTIFLSKKGRVTFPAYTMAVPIEGTDLYRFCEEQGFIGGCSYDSDAPGFYDKSGLLCFSEREKNIRLNVNLLGALISKFPFPLDRLLVLLILVVPPNKVFKWVSDFVFRYYIGKKIYKLVI